MLNFAANLSWMYAELPFEQRFKAAAQDGFTGVECLSPYALPVAQLQTLLRDNGLQLVLLNTPPAGHTAAAMAKAWDGADRGTACLPGREDEFMAGITLALSYAVALACPRIHVMAGLVPPGLGPDALQGLHTCYVANLRRAATEATRVGVGLLIEPINPRDMPGYFLNRQAQAHHTVAEVGAACLQVQMDLYHCQMSEGDVASQLRQYLPTGRVGHLQIAGAPGRHEPDVGEMDYPGLFRLLQALGYSGWIGGEYRPLRGVAAGATSEGLGWLRRWQSQCRA